MTYTASATDLSKPQLGDPAGVAADEIRLLKIRVAGLASAPIGIPQQLINVDYGLVLADANYHLYHTSGTPHTFTIPANGAVAYPIGTCITFVNGSGAGDLTIAITSDVMRLAGGVATGSRVIAANGLATAIKVAATLWYINGTGIS